MMESNTHLSAWAICKRHKKLYLYTICAAISIACIFSYSTPETYNAYTQISIDSNDQNPLKKGKSILSMLPFLNSSESDILTEPRIYHTILSSESFLCHIGNMAVMSEDSTYKGTFSKYLSDKQDKPWWKLLWKNYTQKDLIEESVKLRVNPRNDIITIRVTAQDPLVAFMMVDSIVSHLKSYMTNYMMTKAEINRNNKLIALKQTKEKFDKATFAFNSFKDAHFDAKVPGTLIKMEELENEASSRKQEYNSATLKYKIVEMEAQRSRPTFSTIQSNHKPLEPSDPKWLVNIFVSVFLVTTFTTWYVLFLHKLKWQSR